MHLLHRRRVVRGVHGQRLVAAAASGFGAGPVSAQRRHAAGPRGVGRARAGSGCGRRWTAPPARRPAARARAPAARRPLGAVVVADRGQARRCPRAGRSRSAAAARRGSGPTSSAVRCCASAGAAAVARGQQAAAAARRAARRAPHALDVGIRPRTASSASSSARTCSALAGHAPHLPPLRSARPERRDSARTRRRRRPRRGPSRSAGGRAATPARPSASPLLRMRRSSPRSGGGERCRGRAAARGRR